MRYALRTTPRADADIEAAARWRSRRSVEAASRWHTGIWTAIRSLASNPEECPLAEEASDLALELREFLYGRRRDVYRILFTIEGQTVIIHRVRHAAQDRLNPGDV